MTLSIFDPVREGLTLREAVNRLFEDSVVAPHPQQPAARMPVDVIEYTDHLLIKANLPGCSKDKVQVNFQDETLTIRATVDNTELPEGSRYLLRECFAGEVTRNMTLPVQVDADKASAEFKDGILILTLPKAESIKPRSIPIN